VAADAAQAIVGAGGASVMAALVVVSALGALNGVILAGPRVYYQMAADRLAPAWLGAVHPRLRTPHHALAAQAVWAAALVWLGTYRALFTRVIYTEWIFFGLMAVGLLAARRRAGYAPAFRVPLGPIVPAAFIAACALIAAVRLVDAPAESAVGLLVVALGLPVYHLRRARRRLP
ncbi:MAG TPA: amino acid permease, partial [Vicinamibacterales bacterium]|nr:amino acid permease [Vicinamibacterales bacterium]